MNYATPCRPIRSAMVKMLALVMLICTVSASAQQRDPKKQPLLTEEDIALIKVYEVDLESNPPPRVIIPRDKLRDFLKEFQSDDRIPRGKQAQERWLREDGYVQLDLLFAVKARDYYEHVRVRSQIDSLRTWSNIHRRYILGYFQPTFGSGAIEDLFIFPRGRDSDRIEMTNFYILTQTQINGIPMIDRNVPEESLLVQWGLPRESAKFPAPDDIEGWQPRYKDTDDERFIEHVQWIDSLISANQGSDYDIEYTPPKHAKSRN